MTSRWLIIADDLTGAADCAIAFAKRGMESIVAWEKHREVGSAQVLSVDAATRSRNPEEASRIQIEVLATHYRPGMCIYKKIDSTMRGHPAAELSALLDYAPARMNGRRRMAIVAPAFPGAGRITVNGKIIVKGTPLEETTLWQRDHTYPSADLLEILGSAGLRAEVIPPETVAEGKEKVKSYVLGARERGLDAVVFDATIESDLDGVAAGTRSLSEDVFWVGSAGLASSLAKTESDATALQSTPTISARRNMLVVVGTRAEASRIQAKVLVESGLVRHVLISPEALIAGRGNPNWQKSSEQLTRYFMAQEDVLLEMELVANLELSSGQLLTTRLAQLIVGAGEFGGIVATGGDTVHALLSELGVSSIRLLDEVEPGVPLGMTAGAVSIGVVTKAGAFGEAQTLRRSLERMHRFRDEHTTEHITKDQFMSLPVIAITMGDPAGVGPEIIMKSLAHPELYDSCRPLVIGEIERLRKAGEIVGVDLVLNSVRKPAEGKYKPGTVDVINIPVVPPDLPFGKLSAIAGEAAYRFIECAAKLAMSGEADAICTAPLNKEALHAAGHIFPGHTELLAHLTGTKEVSMLLTAPKLRVIHVTTHLGLIDAIAKINPGLVERTIVRAYDTLVKAGITDPRIAVCGINPHAGEHGLFGHGEEEEKIEPATRKLKERGWKVEGPLPADTVFFRASRGDFDCVVAMYHDQGHGPIKVLGIEAGVNITVGLPVVRTSVDHGTAFDIAGTGKADERSMLEALRQAVELAPKGQPNDSLAA